jgi:hypothetical protein
MSLLVVSASLARAISGRTRPEREPSRCAPKPFRFGRRRTLKEESVLPGPIENRGKRSSSEGNRRKIYSCTAGALRTPRGWTGM